MRLHMRDSNLGSGGACLLQGSRLWLAPPRIRRRPPYPIPLPQCAYSFELRSPHCAKLFLYHGPHTSSHPQNPRPLPPHASSPPRTPARSNTAAARPPLPQHGSLNLAQAATFALGRIFEEAYYATTLPAAGAYPTPNDDPAYMAASAAPQTGGRGAEAGAVAGAYPLGADLTSRRAPLLRPIARVGAPYADASGSYTGDADAPGAWGGHLAAGARPPSLPSLRPASASELDALVRRAISVVYRPPKEAAGASPDAPIGASDGASGGPGGSPSRVVSVRAPEDLPVRDMPGEAAPPPGLGSDWVRTSRGSRPATADQRTAAVLRRILQRSQLTGKELRALHAALRQAERHINGGEYFNG